MSTAGEIINKSTRNNWKDDCFEVNDKTYTQVLVFGVPPMCFASYSHTFNVYDLCDPGSGCILRGGVPPVQ